MTTEKIIDESVAEVKDVFNKFDINSTIYDITGKNEAMFNSVFIKSFLNRLNAGDYEYFKELRDDYLAPVPSLTFSSFSPKDSSND